MFVTGTGVEYKFYLSANKEFNALVIGFPEGDPGLMCISKFLYFPTPGGYFSCKVPVFGEAKHPKGFRTLFWFFEQLANTHRKLNFNYFFLNTT